MLAMAFLAVMGHKSKKGAHHLWDNPTAAQPPPTPALVVTVSLPAT